jgi:hypothetical protein
LQCAPISERSSASVDPSSGYLLKLSGPDPSTPLSPVATLPAISLSGTAVGAVATSSSSEERTTQPTISPATANAINACTNISVKSFFNDQVGRHTFDAGISGMSVTLPSAIAPVLPRGLSDTTLSIGEVQGMWPDAPFGR